MQSMKESAANVAASAKAGMEKTKATAQEKVDKMKAHDPVEKEMATEKKEERRMQAELEKQEAREHNAAAKQATGGLGYTTADSYSHSTTGMHGRPTGGQQMSALAGHGTGQPAGQVTEGVVGSHPIGVNTGTGHNPAHNTRIGGGGGATGYGTELDEQEAREHNAAAKQATGGLGYTTADSYSQSTTGMHGRPTGGHQMSALAGHGTGQPAAQVTEGVVGSHPIGVNTGTGHNPSHNTRVGGGGGATGYGTGGSYT